MKKYIWIFLLLFCALLAAGCGKQDAESKKEEVIAKSEETLDWEEGY